jgi:pantothenate kinase
MSETIQQISTPAIISVPDNLGQIASVIKANWKNMYFGAVPYVDAMQQLTTISDTYGLDSAKSIVIYFLANARTWRGETAKAVKDTLKAMLKAKK